MKERLKNLNCKEGNTGDIFKIKARNYVSAAGPWVDKLRTKDQSMNNKYLHLTKGVHIVFPYEKLPVKQPLYFDVPDGRMIFAIPRGRATYVGTTDTNYSGNLERVVATKDDAEYILNAINSTFPKVNLNIDDIESNWAGLRPLIHEEDKDPSELSRKDEIFHSDSGLISIAGGKLTGYRRMAQRVIEAVLKTMKSKHKENLKKSSTEKIHLVTPALENSRAVSMYQNELELRLLAMGINESYHSWYLCTTYGKQAEIIIEKSKEFGNKDALVRLIRAELWFCIHHEMTNSLTDFLVRRTGRLYFDIPSVKTYKKIISKDCANYLNWDTERLASEEKNLNILIQDATTYYDQEFE